MRCRVQEGTSRGQGNTGDDPRAGEDSADSWRGRLSAFFDLLLLLAQDFLTAELRLPFAVQAPSPRAHLSISLGIFCSHLGTSVWVESSPAVISLAVG